MLLDLNTIDPSQCKGMELKQIDELKNQATQHLDDRYRQLLVAN